MLDIFNSVESNQYLIYEDGTLWIHGHLLCDALGYKDAHQAIIRHTSPDDREKPDSLSMMLNIPWFVNETGIWKLALKSKTDEAVAFREKLCTEILPAIRKKGGYISDTASLEQITKLLNEAERRIETMTMELELAELKVSQMAEYIQGESDRTKIAKASVTEEAIKEAVVDFVCETDDTNGDPLVLQTYLKSENLAYKRLLSIIYNKVGSNKTLIAREVLKSLDPHKESFILN